MEFRISKKEISRQKRVPFIISGILMIFFFFAVFISNEQNKEIDINQILFICVAMSVAIFCIHFYFIHKFIKFSKTHRLETKNDGLHFFNSNIQTTIPWNEINEIIVKGNDKNIKRLTVKLTNKELIELSIYNNLETLNSELNQYI